MNSNAASMAGFVLASLGAGCGVYGALRQANAYYPFRLREFPRHLWSVMKAARLREQGGPDFVRLTAELARYTGESRPQALAGLYWVVLGFVLQLAGSVVSLAASWQSSSK